MTVDVSTPSLPALTFPAEEASYVLSAYKQAEVVLEYGSGGSTLMAMDIGVSHVMSVESDPAWAEKMRQHITDHSSNTQVDLLHVDIGPTKKWGRPADRMGWPRYHRYPTAVWDADFFRQPDLVLIDGRFRPGCLLTVLLRTKAPVKVIFDDYVGRPIYAQHVEHFIQPSGIIGRAALFDVVPSALQPQDLTRFLAAYACVD